MFLSVYPLGIFTQPIKGVTMLTLPKLEYGKYVLMMAGECVECEYIPSPKGMEHHYPYGCWTILNLGILFSHENLFTHPEVSIVGPVNQELE